MPVVALTNIEKSFGRRVLFDHLTFAIEKGERLGLIGVNGSGKTTLFRLIVGDDTPEAGQITLAAGVKIGYLSQDPSFTAGSSVIDEAERAFASLHELAHQLRDLEHAMAARQGEELDKTLERYQTVQHEFDLAGGYTWRYQLEATLLGVGLERDTWQQPVETLSGGQRSRLALAQLLINQPDLLLLDEPTNHLDLAAIEWVENYLASFKGAVMLISHDRFLLDRVATRIVWLTQAKLKSYPGNYTSFTVQREIEELTQQRAYSEQQADIEKQKEYIRRFGAGQRARQAKGREKRLDRLLSSDQMIREVGSQKKIHLKISTDQRAGDRVLTVKDLSKSFPSNQSPEAPPRVLWESLNFDVTRGERIGLIGPNGSGKTTLLKVLLGQEDADAGEMRWGANLNIGYYDQRQGDLDPELSIYEQVSQGRQELGTQAIRNVLGMMLFSDADVEKPIALLSGGERARVRLAELLLDKPNVLLLDEPTNHLDIASVEALERAINGFGGTVLCVSHDRYFLDKTARRLFVLQPPGMLDFEGNYSRWHAKQSADAKVQAAAQRDNSARKKDGATSSLGSSRRNSAAERKSKNADNPYLRPFGLLSMEQLEAQITETEIAIAECQQAFTDSESFKDPSRANELQRDYDQLATKLEELEAEYFAREA